MRGVATHTNLVRWESCNQVLIYEPGWTYFRGHMRRVFVCPKCSRIIYSVPKRPSLVHHRRLLDSDWLSAEARERISAFK